MKSVFKAALGTLLSVLALNASNALASTDYPPAIWNPAASCNYSARTVAPTHVAIHTMEGSYAGSISWFQMCAASVSAHYMVRSSDGQITQMVAEADKAWHVGSANGYTIGIEHEGYAASPATWYTTAMYNASANLSKNILSNIGATAKVYDGALGWNTVLATADYNIKGHVNYPSQTHTDPGSGWDWARYKNLIDPAVPPALVWPVVQQGDISEAVRTVQYLLRQWGYSTVTADKNFGSGTLAAVKNFQLSKGLTGDGVVGNATWTQLVITTQQGDSGEKVKAVQWQLGITADGIFGAGTAASVKSFQTSKGLASTGIVDTPTWNKLAY